MILYVSERWRGRHDMWQMKHDIWLVKFVLVLVLLSEQVESLSDSRMWDFYLQNEERGSWGPNTREIRETLAKTGLCLFWSCRSPGKWTSPRSLHTIMWKAGCGNYLYLYIYIFFLYSIRLTLYYPIMQLCQIKWNWIQPLLKLELAPWSLVLPNKNLVFLNTIIFGEIEPRKTICTKWNFWKHWVEASYQSKGVRKYQFKCHK